MLLKYICGIAADVTNQSITKFPLVHELKFYRTTLLFLPQFTKMISNVLARSAMRASTRQVVRSDLYHFSNSNGQVMPLMMKLICSDFIT